VALSDSDKDFLKIPIVTATFLEVLGKTTGVDTFQAASQALQLVPIEQIAESLAALRTDEVFIEAGTIEIDGVGIEIVDDEDL
tara:strand:- start:4666 stop:4914 length:249 start_codon:yes stop_codon:yes gene_type:complete